MAVFYLEVHMPYRRSDMCQAIEEFVINPRYRLILKYRFCEGMTYENIAELTNYSTQHVKFICKKYKAFLMNQT